MDEHIQVVKDHLKKAIEHLEEEFSKIQVGRASTSMVDTMIVRAYGQDQPLKNVATITTPSADQIRIEPWDKSVLNDVESSIRERSELGLNPNNDGQIIWIKIPTPTEELRLKWKKLAHKLAEDAKIAIRVARQDFLKHLKANDDLSEDQKKSFESSIQEDVVDANKKIDELLKVKDIDIMAV